jgi:hypothetical protein
MKRAPDCLAMALGGASPSAPRRCASSLPSHHYGGREGLARTLAIIVLPVPGGPYSRMPYGADM